MFVGEGPGFNEDQQGRPFVGQAGRLLEELLATIGLTRQDVYITNVIKCRPPNNRDPLPEEIAACKHYLERQIELIGPKLIVTLGRFSLGWFFPKDGISRTHGHLRRLGDRHFYHLYHPAAALRSTQLRQVMEADFRRIPQALDKAREQEAVQAAVLTPVEVPAARQGRLL